RGAGVRPRAGGRERTPGRAGRADRSGEQPGLALQRLAEGRSRGPRAPLVGPAMDPMAAARRPLGAVSGQHAIGASLAWPAADRARAIAALAERNGCFDAAGADAQDVEADYRDLGEVVGRLAPGLIRLEVEGSVRLLAVWRASGRRLTIIAPDLSVTSVRTSAVCARLCEELESAACAPIDATLERTAVAPARRLRARRALLHERLGASKIGGLTILRPPPEASVWSQARFFGLHRRFALLLLTYAVYYALWIGSWV